MRSCEKPNSLASADIVWIEGGRLDPAVAATDAVFSIGEMAEKFQVTPRALRFYESRGLLAPRREGRARLYGSADCHRLALILKGKKLGFTLTEITDMVAAEEGRASASVLKLNRQKCLEQIGMLEQQLADVQQALAELRQLHTVLSGRLPAGAGQQ